MCMLLHRAGPRRSSQAGVSERRVLDELAVDAAASSVGPVLEASVVVSCVLLSPIVLLAVSAVARQRNHRQRSAHHLLAPNLQRPGPTNDDFTATGYRTEGLFLERRDAARSECHRAALSRNHDFAV